MATKNKGDDLFEYMKKLNEFAFIPAEGSMYDLKGWSDTGVGILNLVLSDADIDKGLVDGKRYVLAGENSVAKTLVALQIVSSFLKKDPDNKVFYFESESAVLSQHLDEVGIDKQRIMILPVAFIEDFRTQVLNVLDKIIEKKESKEGCSKHYLICLDSLGMMSSRDEEEKSLGDSDKKSMSKPQLIASTYRQIAMRCARSQCPFITIQHVHNKTGGNGAPATGFGFKMPDKEIQGGEVLRYCGDVIIYLSKANEYDESKTAKVGIKAMMKIKKSRFMKDNVTFPLTILYGVGILKYSGLFDEGIKAGIFSPRSNFYDNTISGKKFFKADLKNRPEEIYDEKTLGALKAYLANKYSLFGKANDSDVDEFVDDSIDAEAKIGDQ